MEGTSRKAYFGYCQIVPKNDCAGKQTTSYPYQLRQQGDQSGLYQRTSKTSFVDKQTGKYARVTNKVAVSGGETFKERSTGRIGYKDEHKTINSYRVGRKSGYDEYQLEERFRRINFDGSGSKNNKIGNYGGGSGSYQKFGGHSDNVGSYCTYTYVNCGGGAVLDGYSSFEDEDHSEEYEESDMDGEESKDYTDESEGNDEEEAYEESGTEEEVYESDDFVLEVNDDTEEEYGEYDSLYSDYDDYYDSLYWDYYSDSDYDDYYDSLYSDYDDYDNDQEYSDYD